MTRRGGEVQQHLRHLVILCVLVRVLTVTIAFLASYLPSFDTSAQVLLPDNSQSLLKQWIATSLRWDTFHFLGIAQENYQFEHQWAFFPGVPIILRGIKLLLGIVGQSVGGTSIYGMLTGHFIMSTIITCETTRTLYLLTLEHTQSTQFSLLSGYLSLLSSSPATLHLAPCPEPWFTFFSYKGMLYGVQKRWFAAALSFFFASMLRSNGVLLGIFIFWGMVAELFITQRRVNPRSVLICVLLLAFLSLPFLLHQLHGYLAFCLNPLTPAKPTWCTRIPPLIYTYVQSQYWNVGFLRYWTLQQLPNFLISAPVLSLLFFSSVTYILRIWPSLYSVNIKSEFIVTQPLVILSLAPHALHALVLTSVLFFASHTQIVLRLASSMPFTYWSAASLFFEHPRCAKAWVAWSLLWGAMSIVLWTTFLPPA